MKVGEKHAVDILPAHLELGQALHRPPADVEEKPLSPSFDEDARPESGHGWHRRAGPEKSDFDLLGVRRNGKKCNHEPQHEHPTKGLHRSSLLRDSALIEDGDDLLPTVDPAQRELAARLVTSARSALR